MVERTNDRRMIKELVREHLRGLGEFVENIMIEEVEDFILEQIRRGREDEEEGENVGR